MRFIGVITHRDVFARPWIYNTAVKVKPLPTPIPTLKN